MALIIEDGTIVEDANSYISLEYFKEYFILRNEAFTNTDEELNALIIKATQFIDNGYKFKGIIQEQEQDLSFPRILLYTREGFLVEGIPKKLKKAVCEATKLLVNNTDLFKAEESGTNAKSVTVGPIKESYSYRNGASVKTVYTVVKDYLYDYIKPHDNFATVVRS